MVFIGLFVFFKLLFAYLHPLNVNLRGKTKLTSSLQLIIIWQVNVAAVHFAVLNAVLAAAD